MAAYKDFLQKIPSFDDFIHVSDESYFLPVPEDWSLILTDIKGSTKAVQSGRYQEVNMVGAAGITALLNAFSDRELPFVFGGDGATLLIPPEHKKEAANTLRRVQRWSQQEFNLELRASVVDLSDVYREGHRLLLGKYQLSEGNIIYQFRGGALKKAEELMKKNLGGVALSPQDEEADPDLTGLSCRWEPLSAQKGLILTVLVSAHGDEARAFSIYSKLLEDLRHILGGDFKGACPTQKESLVLKWPPKTLAVEAKAQPGPFILGYLSTVVRSLCAYILIRYNIPIGNFDPLRYRQELISNSDFQKYDDVLRMVLDCSQEQATQIETLLKRYEERGDISFGVHRSAQALMTCLVFSSSENRHLHFIDGAQGGYTLAAASLKSKKPLA